MAIKHRNKDKKPTVLKFMTLDLNESNVNMIFERCLANADDDITSRVYINLLDTHLGFDEEDKTRVFNYKRIKDNRLNILYLIGQLDKSHNNTGPFEFSLASLKYDGTQWTLSPANVAKLFYLGSALVIEDLSVVALFRKINDQTIVEVWPDVVKPTLSPKDPDFDAWWAEHKAEWGDTVNDKLNAMIKQFQNK